MGSTKRHVSIDLMDLLALSSPLFAMELMLGVGPVILGLEVVAVSIPHALRQIINLPHQGPFFKKAC